MAFSVTSYASFSIGIAHFQSLLVQRDFTKIKMKRTKKTERETHKEEREGKERRKEGKKEGNLAGGGKILRPSPPPSFDLNSNAEQTND
jgi:hypothetical protein